MSDDHIEFHREINSLLFQIIHLYQVYMELLNQKDKRISALEEQVQEMSVKIEQLEKKK